MNHWNIQENIRHRLALKELIIQLEKRGTRCKTIQQYLRLCVLSVPKQRSQTMLREEMISINQCELELVLRL